MGDFGRLRLGKDERSPWGRQHASGPAHRRVQDLSERVLRLNSEDNALLANWSAVQRQDPRYSAVADEFRAASLARGKATQPTVKRQTELVQQLTALLQRCPPAQKKAGCEGSESEIQAISKQLGELSQASASGSDEIMAIHRRLEAAEKALPGYAEFTARRAKLRREVDDSESEVRQAREDISKSFPQYVALADPKPLSVAEVRALLRDDETLIAMLVGASTSFVWAVTRERTAWAEIAAGSKTLAEHVTALRAGLDPLAQQDAAGSATGRAGVVQGFDLSRAHELYRLVLGPVAELINSKHHLIVVPTGPLTSLPLQVLVKEPPRLGGIPEDTFRRVPWLIRSQALSVLPSVQSLSALRKLATPGAASKPFFGVGDPILRGPLDRQQRSAHRQLAQPSRFYRNGLADTRAVRELPPLPDTADELRSIAKLLGASAGCRQSSRGGLRKPRQNRSLARVPRDPFRHPRSHRWRPFRSLRTGPGSHSTRRSKRCRRWPTDSIGDRCTAARCRLGGPLCLQHRRRRRRGCRGAVRIGTRLFLCRRARPPGLALVGVFDRRHRTYHQDLCRARRRASHRTRRGLPSLDVDTDRRGAEPILLGPVRDRRRGGSSGALTRGQRRLPQPFFGFGKASEAPGTASAASPLALRRRRQSIAVPRMPFGM